MNHLQAWIIVLSQVTLTFTSPIYTSTFVSGDIGRDIKNFACVSKRTGEIGVCMFAATCQRANGTHLSTCIDRFYFGSCCKLHEKPEVHPLENTTKVEFAPSPFATTDSAIENNYIPDDIAKPKPILEKETVSSTTSTISQITMTTTLMQIPLVNTSYPTTQIPISMSTFQKLDNYSEATLNIVTTESVLQESSSSSSAAQNSLSTESTTLINTNAEVSSPKPTLSTFADTKRPAVVETTMKMPSSVNVDEPSDANQPAMSSTARPSSSMTERIPASTRFPPRNATTMRPNQMTITSLRPTDSTTSLGDASPEMATMTSSSWTPATPSANEESTVSTMSLVFNGTILTNEILQPEKVTTTVVSTEEDVLSTQPPGLVTWSSYVNNEVTNAPEIWTTNQEGKPANSASTDSIPSLGSTVPTTPSIVIDGDHDQELFIPTANFNMSDYKQVCGTRLLPDSRIVGGGPSTFGKWPWQLSLQRWNISSSAFEHSCGAVLLTNNWAITAAHCVEEVPWKYLRMIIGDHDIKTKDEPYESQERRVQFAFSHPQFDQPTFEYDVAVLRFDKPLATFQPNILPICLPNDDDYFVGQSAFVTGWGRLYHNGPVPSVLREVSVPVISNAACEGMYERAGYKERIPNIFICAGRRKGGIDSCEGDSGGPMVIQRASDGRWILAGVISWGIGCGASNQPGVYTRISEFREWISKSIQLIDEAYIEAEALL